MYDSQKGPDLAYRVFHNRPFQTIWALFLFLIAIPASWPIRDALLVIWVRGSEAYFHRGIRVLPGKPIRFSDGGLAPMLPDMVTGFGVFFIATLGLSLGVVALLRASDRLFRRQQSGS